MKVSAIVPSHGHRRFLPKRLLSITAQSHPPDELIIIDDGSTDGSTEWLRSFRCEIPLQLECRPVASGNPFAMWNAGAARATGDWLWIAESDDAAEPKFLAVLLAAAARHPDAALVMCQSATVDSRGRVTGHATDYTNSADTETWRTDFVLDGRTAVARLLLYRNTIPNVSACLISRRAWIAAGGAEMSLDLCGDWLTYARLLAHGSLVFCAETLNRHRHHSHTKRARTAAAEYVRQGYIARRRAAELHAVPEAAREFARRYAWDEASRVLGAAPADLPRALPAEVATAGRAFDPHFDQRARHAALLGWDRCDVFVDPAGAFAESNRRRQAVTMYDAWETIVFRRCAGLVRLDPFARPGRCGLRRVAMLVAGTDEVLWSANAGNAFAGLVPGPGVHLVAEGDALGIACAHEDPQLFLPPPPDVLSTQFDLVVELRHPLE